MKRNILSLLASCLLFSAFAQNSLEGVYVGLEEMCYTDKSGKKDCYTDPAQPKYKWYHLCYIKIKGDSVYMDQSPVAMYKKDTLFSASDGAFYYYRGTMSKKDTTVTIHLKEYYCDYCAVRSQIKPDGTRQVIKREKQYAGRLTAKGILINGYLFRPTAGKPYLNSEKPRRGS